MLMFFHGLESGPHGAKYQLLSKAFGEVNSPDFQGMDLEQRLAHAEEITRGATGLTIVGSSFGGLVAALLYAQVPDRIHALVLLAPALHRDIADAVPALPPHTVVIHGIHDDVVPLDEVRAFCQNRGVEVIEVDDGHRLLGSMPLVIKKVRSILPSDRVSP